MLCDADLAVVLPLMAELTALCKGMKSWHDTFMQASIVASGHLRHICAGTGLTAATSASGPAQSSDGPCDGGAPC